MGPENKWNTRTTRHEFHCYCDETAGVVTVIITAIVVIGIAIGLSVAKHTQRIEKFIDGGFSRAQVGNCMEWVKEAHIVYVKSNAVKDEHYEETATERATYFALKKKLLKEAEGKRRR